MIHMSFPQDNLSLPAVNACVLHSWLSYRLCNQSRAARIEGRNKVIASEFSGLGSEGFFHFAVVS
jgi:hypothetical protein